jgi:dienelactone hydrolase
LSEFLGVKCHQVLTTIVLTMDIQALFHAAQVEGVAAPHNTLHLKVFYPAQPLTDEGARILGMVPANIEQAPFKVVILFNGVNCGPESYHWLAVTLAQQGLVVVTFAWVAQNIPGIVALTPGVDLSRLAPDTYGTGPTASAMETLLLALEELQSQGILAGLLDLQNIVIGGHSAGGRVAIESASPKFFPQVKAAFAYGAHTAAITQMGYAPGTILALPDSLPLLLIAGTCDGVIHRNSHLYGVIWETPTTPVERTFREAMAGGRNDSYLMLLTGANHFSIAHPFDGTIGTSFLDYPATQPLEQLREVMGTAIDLFIKGHVCHHPMALAELQQLGANHSLIATFVKK